MNIALITMDSLRYDVASQTRAPNLERALSLAKAGTWRKCYAPGTYTLPSHISMFHAGFLPDNRAIQEPIYNRAYKGAFRAHSDLHGSRNVLYEVPMAASVVQGFALLGYRTVGIGGVGWFDARTETGKIWAQYFDEFLWDESFHEQEPSALENQIKVAERLGFRDNLFLFWNIPSTHTPYCGHGRSMEGQKRALQYVDSLLPRMMAVLPRPCHVFLCSDHGDCLGEDGLVGHGFYHKKVMEVPMVHFILR